MNYIKQILTADVPLWLASLVVVMSIVTTTIMESDPVAVDPVKVTTITLTGEGGESIFSFRIQESESEDEKVAQN